MKTNFMSIVTCSILLGSLSNLSATAGPVSCTSLTNSGSTAANSLSSTCSEVSVNEVHTITGSAVTFYGDVQGASDGVGQIIIDGDVNLGYENLGTSSKSLNNVTINSGKTLTLNNTGDIDATSISVGGTLDVFYGGATIIGTIDGTSDGVGVLDINSSFSTGGVIGGTNKLSSINIADGRTMTLNHDVSSSQISIGSSNLAFYGDGVTIASDIVSRYTNDGSVTVNNNATFKGKIGTSTNRIAALSISSGKTLTLSGDVFKNPIYTNTFSFNGANLNINPTNSTIADGSSFTIIDSSSFINYGTTSITDTILIDYTITENDNTVVVSASYNSGSTLGLTGETATIFNNAKTAIGSNSGLFTALNNTTTSTQRKEILESLKPDGSFNASVGGINLSTSTGGTISTHLAALRQTGSDTGIATGDQLKGLNVWAQVFGNDIEQDNRKGSIGYDADGHGFVIGADKLVTDDTTFGLAFSIGNSNITSKSTYSASTDITSYQLATYLSKELSNNYFAEGILSYSINNNTSTRNIAGGSTAYSDFDSKILQTQFTIGKFIDMGDYKIIPKAKLSYTNVNTDSYTETGAAGLNLSVNTDNLNKFEVYGGATITKAIDLSSNASFLPEFRLGLTHQLGDDSIDTNSTFQAGGNFNNTGLKAASTSLDTGLGLAYVSADKLSEIRFDYDLSTKSDYLKHAGTLTFKYKF